MKQFLLLLSLWFSPMTFYCMSNSEIPYIRENEDESLFPSNAVHAVLDPKSGYVDKIEGHMFEVEDGKYLFVKDKNHQFAFRPSLKTNTYTGETIPFNLLEFSKAPDFNNCELLEFIWEDQSPNKTGVSKIYGVEGLIIAFENDLCQSYILKPNKRFLIRDGKYIKTLFRGNINYYVVHQSYDLDIFIRPQDIDKVYGTSLNYLKNDTKPLIWHSDTRIIEDPDGCSFKLNSIYNADKAIVTVLASNNTSISKKIEITSGADVPISYSENENVLTLNYSNGDYCKFSKIKENELFECLIHFPFGILKASPTSDGNGVNKTFECTGKIFTYGSGYDYSGFSTDLSSLKMYLDPQNGSNYTRNVIKFDDSTQLQQWIEANSKHRWTLTSTGEQARWQDGRLVTESIIAKRKQDKIAQSQKIHTEVISAYKAKYGAATIDNIMKGRITVGMPWALVGSVFPNGLFNNSQYSKTYKVINNIPRIDYGNKKLVKEEYGMGNLVWVTVQNGKITNVTYTNHR